MEVPTIISYSSLQRTVEHYVDIPVPGGGGPISGLQGLPSGQSSTALPSKKRISERIVEQIVDPVSSLFQVDVFQDMVHLLLTLQLVLKNVLMSLVKGFFRTFPKRKKCEVGFALGVGTAPRVRPIFAGCSAGGLRRVGAAP